MIKNIGIFSLCNNFFALLRIIRLSCLSCLGYNFSQNLKITKTGSIGIFYLNPDLESTYFFGTGKLY